VTEEDLLVDLTRLSVGARARFRGSELARSDLDLLEALGLTEGSRFRVCQTGDPWIVQVRATRIGIAESVARQILVLPEEQP
jgi:Fe2+ transport system protein FeoA